MLTYRHDGEKVEVFMNYEFLKKNAEFLGENDIYANGIYSGTDEYYLYNDEVYRRTNPTNAFRYDGKPTTEKIVGDFIDGNAKKQLRKYNKSYFVDLLGIPEKIYEKLIKK